MNLATKLMAGAAVVTGLSLAPVLESAAQTWDMPTPYPQQNFHTQNIIEFAEEIEAATDGALTINVHPAGSLYEHPEIKNAVRSRQVQIGEFLLSRLANEDPVFEADSVPFLATDYEQAEKLWEASKPHVEEILERERLKVLFTVPWPPQGLYTDGPVESADDIAGLSFRAYNTATEELAQLAGMSPTQVEVPDIPQAFATGRVDAMMTSPSTGVNTQAWDFLTHYYHLQAWIPKNIVVVNQQVFDALDESVQTAVLDAAEQAQTRGWEKSREETVEQMDVLEENGVEVHRDPPEALASAFQEIGREMAEKWEAEGGEAVADILARFREMN